MTSKIQVVVWGNPFDANEPHRYGVRVGKMNIAIKRDDGVYTPLLYDTREEALADVKIRRKRLKEEREAAALAAKS